VFTLLESEIKALGGVTSNEDAAKGSRGLDTKKHTLVLGLTTAARMETHGVTPRQRLSGREAMLNLQEKICFRCHGGDSEFLRWSQWVTVMPLWLNPSLSLVIVTNTVTDALLL
jgi:hypothetical protein